MKSKTARVSELIHDGKTNPEIVDILDSEGYSINKQDGSWITLSKKEKRQELDQDVRNIKSRILTKERRQTPEIKELERKKLELEIDKLESEKQKRDINKLTRILKE